MKKPCRTSHAERQTSYRDSARIIWEYLKLNQEPALSDCLLVLGSNDIRIAEYAAGLFLDGWAPFLLFTVGIAHETDLLSTGWDKAEADRFADRAIEMGVPAQKILRETKATNTGENIEFSEAMMKQNGIDSRRLLVVHKPYMERRIWASIRTQRPDWDITVISPPISFDAYPVPQIGLTEEVVISIMVGDLQRIVEYPEKGYQIHQAVPEKVKKAFDTLVGLGFDGHLL